MSVSTKQGLLIEGYGPIAKYKYWLEESGTPGTPIDGADDLSPTEKIRWLEELRDMLVAHSYGPYCGPQEDADATKGIDFINTQVGILEQLSNEDA